MLRADREPDPGVEPQHQPAPLVEGSGVHLAIPLVPFGILSVHEITDEGD